MPHWTGKIVCCFIYITNQRGVSISVPPFLTVSFPPSLRSLFVSLFKHFDSRMHYVSVIRTGRGYRDQMHCVQKTQREEEREVRRVEREQMHVCVLGILDQCVCVCVRCVCVCVCVLASVQMADVNVEKFMMPCLEIPGGYLALVNGHRTSPVGACVCVCVFVGNTESKKGER